MKSTLTLKQKATLRAVALCLASGRPARVHHCARWDQVQRRLERLLAEVGA